ASPPALPHAATRPTSARRRRATWPGTSARRRTADRVSWQPHDHDRLLGAVVGILRFRRTRVERPHRAIHEKGVDMPPRRDGGHYTPCAASGIAREWRRAAIPPVEVTDERDTLRGRGVEHELDGDGLFLRGAIDRLGDRLHGRPRANGSVVRSRVGSNG